MAGNIWVLAEHWRGEISDITYECLALGREVANALGVKLEVLLMGHSAEPLAANLGAADKAIVIDDPALDVVVPDAYADPRVRRAILEELHAFNATRNVRDVWRALASLTFINTCRNCIRRCVY